MKFYDVLLNKENMKSEDLAGMFQFDDNCTYALSWAGDNVTDINIHPTEEIIELISSSVDMERYDWARIEVVPSIIEENLHADAIVIFTAGYGYEEW